jgi:hypothetical protein
MAIDINVRVEARQFKRSLTRLEKRELPFATALALTTTAKDVQKNTVKRLSRVLDRPTRFTLGAFRVLPATKRKLVAKVGFREFTQTSVGFRSYLEPLEYGGKRPPKRFEKRLRAIGVMRADEFAVPARGFRLNRYGNIPASRFVQILSQLRAFNDAGYDANETSRSRQRAGKGRARYFAVRSTSNQKTNLPPGIYERRAKGKVKGVMMFVKQPVYRAVLGFHDGAEKTVRARLPINFRRAMDRALRTSKLK